MLRCAVMFTKLTTGLQVTDTHNGLRAFTADAAALVFAGLFFVGLPCERTLSSEFLRGIGQDAPAVARAVMQEVVEHYPSASSEMHTYIALTYRFNAQRKVDLSETLTNLAMRIPGLLNGLVGAGAGSVGMVLAEGHDHEARDVVVLLEIAELSDEDIGFVGIAAGGGVSGGRSVCQPGCWCSRAS